MTNKITTGGKVYLVGGHHDLPTTEELADQDDLGRFLKERDYTLLTEVLLSQPFTYTNCSDAENQAWSDFYFSALRGLTFLGDGFVIFVSLGVGTTKEGGLISHSRKREWCEIRLASTGELALHLSGGTRKNNSDHLLSWTREDLTEKNLMAVIKQWSTPEVWKIFFLRQIQARVNCLKVQHSGLKRDAHSLGKKINDIESLLPHQ